MKRLILLLISIIILSGCNDNAQIEQQDKKALIIGVTRPESPEDSIKVYVPKDSSGRLVFYSYDFNLSDSRIYYARVFRDNDTGFFALVRIDTLHKGRLIIFPKDTVIGHTYKITLHNDSPDGLPLQDLDNHFMPPGTVSLDKYSAHLDYANEGIWPFNSNTDGVIVIIMNEL